jgi:hypothetical protein
VHAREEHGGGSQPSRFRITIAEAGHADRNSTDSRTD